MGLLCCEREHTHVGLCMRYAFPPSGKGNGVFADGLKRAVDIGLGSVGVYIWPI